MAVKESIECLDDAVEAVYNTVQKGSWAFRGQSNYNWAMLPSLLRKPRYEALLLQRSLLKQFLLRKAEFPFLKNNDPLDYLMLLQHFNVPTKLLDLSLDPFVALFFACFDPLRRTDTPGKLCIFPVAQFERLEINTPNQNVFNEPITEQNVKILFERMSPDRHLFFEPMYKNARMRAQDGCFLLFSILPPDKGSNEFASLELFLMRKNQHLNREESSKEKCGRFWHAHKLVPAAAKNRILIELDERFGINRKSMFPETPYLQSVESTVQQIYRNAVDGFDDLRQTIPGDFTGLPY